MKVHVPDLSFERNMYCPLLNGGKIIFSCDFFTDMAKLPSEIVGFFSTVAT